jgi:hypothetical protein
MQINAGVDNLNIVNLYITVSGATIEGCTINSNYKGVFGMPAYVISADKKQIHITVQPTTSNGLTNIIDLAQFTFLKSSSPVVVSYTSESTITLKKGLISVTQPFTNPSYVIGGY